MVADEGLTPARKLREGGGASRVAKMHAQGKLYPRERVTALLDPGAPWHEIGLLVAYDEYEGQAPAAGVITGVGVVEGREVVVVANDATVQAGSWWPEAIRKQPPAPEDAVAQRAPPTARCGTGAGRGTAARTPAFNPGELTTWGPGRRIGGRTANAPWSPNSAMRDSDGPPG